jgi:hypothetical protein
MSVSHPQLLTTVTVDGLGTPGLKSILSLVVPDQRSGKVYFSHPSIFLILVICNMVIAAAKQLICLIAITAGFPVLA